jgi:hypothetical protein
MKLYKFEILIDEFYSEKDDIRWPAMKQATEIREIPVKNPAELMRYIDRYKERIRMNSLRTKAFTRKTNKAIKT